jgi:hypothetical protein
MAVIVEVVYDGDYYNRGEENQEKHPVGPDKGPEYGQWCAHYVSQKWRGTAPRIWST